MVVVFSSFFGTLLRDTCHRVRLAKVPLCLLIGCSTLFGYILADPVLSLPLFLTGLGIFVIAAGAASLNSMQEHQLDRELPRTKNRVLPMGLMTPSQAGRQAVILFFIGLLLLYTANKTVFPVMVAAFSTILYNGLYTPLKKETIWAIVPGTICGALPPYIGWISGGGAPISYTGTLLIVLFALWQVPHFWLVLLTFKDDYERSKLPNFLKQFNEDSIKRFFVTWIGALVVVMLMFLVLPYPLGLTFRIMIAVNGALLLVIFTYGLAIRKDCDYKTLFHVLNLALLLHMTIFSVGRMYT